MYSLDELKKQNQEISHLCDVLAVVMEQPALHKNPYVCELMSRFKEKVWMHLVFEDNTLYVALLHNENKNISQMAKAFHDSAKEIKHHFSGFVRQLCSAPATESEHQSLITESRRIFSLIRERVEYENTKIFPLVESH
ncbi:MAG: hemerythrin domain-containing protein [Gammaproteobacteria bacterium]|nr:hemerythrin domain-containing protein [Gammaproteobacteria bacterium]